MAKNNHLPDQFVKMLQKSLDSKLKFKNLVESIFLTSVSYLKYNVVVNAVIVSEDVISFCMSVVDEKS